jgi:hypothetical protein
MVENINIYRRREATENLRSKLTTEGTEFNLTPKVGRDINDDIKEVC